MAIDTDIRDQAYQFFIQEAPELLQVIETELLTLRQERNTAKIHSMMRAAHSIKGGAASIGLDVIKSLAHRLEDSFRALHHEELEIDAALETALLQAYDCLRLPLMQEITDGYFDPEQTIALAEPVFTQLETHLEDFLGADASLPSSIELGVDITASIFEVDVAEGIARLSNVLQRQQNQEMRAELHAQAEVFVGIAELLALPGFGTIAQTVLAALEAHPNQAIAITQEALACFQAARQAVLAGDRSQGGTPSAALLQFINSSPTELPTPQISVNQRTLEEVLREDTVELPTLDYPAPEESFKEDTLVLPALDNFWENMSFDVVGVGLDDEGNQQISREELPEFDVDSAWNGFLMKPDADQVNNLPVDKAVAPEISACNDGEITEAADLDLSLIFQTASVFEEADQSTLQDRTGMDRYESKIPLPDVKQPPALPEVGNTPQFLQDQLQELVVSIEQTFDCLPTLAELPTVPQSTPAVKNKVEAPITAINSIPDHYQKYHRQTAPTGPSEPANQLSVRVALERLERMNNLVGELAINRNSLSLQNDQLQTAVQELLRRFDKFQTMGVHLRDLSDQLVVARDRYNLQPSLQVIGQSASRQNSTQVSNLPVFDSVDFDSLEMDRYSDFHLFLQSTLEEIAQIEETVGDIVLLSSQSNRTLEGQRQMLNHLRDDLMWARMLPLNEILNRFPRILRDLSANHHKPVNLKLSGTGVLIDKAVLEKLYDPLLHLLRNAFDHGIEPSELRHQQGKPKQGQIEVRAYHQASQTVIEVRDDGRGVNLEQIRKRALELGLLTSDQVTTASTSRLFDLLFEPGFSTAERVSDLSGRGVGLDVVRAQLRALKGTVTLTSEAGRGTTFTLRIPLTLTIAKLLVCVVNSTALALPSDSVEAIVVPRLGQIKQSNEQRFLHWRNSLVPLRPLSQLLEYNCPLPETLPSQALVAVPAPSDWANPLLLLRQDNQIIALEIDRIVTEQELVIKPFGSAISPPSYIRGCTILGDGNLIPVIDGAALFDKISHREQANSSSKIPTPFSTAPQMKLSTVLIVDDSIALRQTLALTLQKAGYRVLQAQDGREAIEQLQQNTTIQLVICDVEMPNMNGFEFLNYRRQDPELSAIPVAMLTSRGSDKHRRLAMHLGANAYVTKPYIEREFLTLLANLLNASAESEAIPVLDC